MKNQKNKNHQSMKSRKKEDFSCFSGILEIKIGSAGLLELTAANRNKEK